MDQHEDEHQHGHHQSNLPLMAEETSPTTLRSKARGREPGAFVWALTFAAGISSVLAGYETAVTSAALVSIGTSLSGRALTSLDKSMITSSTALAALFASPLASVLADRAGRKCVLLCADVLFVVGSLLQASSSTVALAVLGRSIIGAAVGSSSVAVPLYITEVAPASHRGRLVVLPILLVTVGQALGFMVAGGFASWASPGQESWRWTVALGALPAIAQAATVVLFMTDTPRWLVMVGRLEAARRVMRRIQGNDGDAAHQTDALVRGIEREARELRDARQLRLLSRSGLSRLLGPWRELASEARYRRALAIACLLQALQQLCGFNSLMYYSATIFSLVGFQDPNLVSLAITATNFAFTALALRLIDKVGRRKMLLRSMPSMIFGLLCAAVGFSLLPLRVSSDAPQESGHSGAAGLVLASIVVFVTSFALGLGNVPATQSELYPLAVRSLGSGVATTVSWSGNFIVGLTFLPLMDALTPSWTLVLYAVVCTMGYYVLYLIYPEMAGLNLEEAAAVLEHGWRVQ